MTVTRALLSDGGLPARGLGNRQGGGAGARRRSNPDGLRKLAGAGRLTRRGQVVGCMGVFSGPAPG